MWKTEIHLSIRIAATVAAAVVGVAIAHYCRPINYHVPEIRAAYPSVAPSRPTPSPLNSKEDRDRYERILHSIKEYAAKSESLAPEDREEITANIEVALDGLGNFKWLDIAQKHQLVLDINAVFRETAAPDSPLDLGQARLLLASIGDGLKDIARDAQLAGENVVWTLDQMDRLLPVIIEHVDALREVDPALFDDAAKLCHPQASVEKTQTLEKLVVALMQFEPPEGLLTMSTTLTSLDSEEAGEIRALLRPKAEEIAKLTTLIEEYNRIPGIADRWPEKPELPATLMDFAKSVGDDSLIPPKALRTLSAIASYFQFDPKTPDLVGLGNLLVFYDSISPVTLIDRTVISVYEGFVFNLLQQAALAHPSDGELQAYLESRTSADWLKKRSLSVLDSARRERWIQSHYMLIALEDTPRGQKELESQVHNCERSRVIARGITGEDMEPEAITNQIFSGELNSVRAETSARNQMEQVQTNDEEALLSLVRKLICDEHVSMFVTSPFDLFQQARILTSLYQIRGWEVEHGRLPKPDEITLRWGHTLTRDGEQATLANNVADWECDWGETITIDPLPKK